VIGSREAILGAMCLRPNMTMTIHHIQRAVFLVEVGFYGDPIANTTGFGFHPGAYGPVSHEVFNEVCQLASGRSIAALSGIGLSTYIPLESGYAEGLSILSSLSPVRRHGFIETVTWVNNSTIEEMAASFRQCYPEFITNELQEK
jgi:hypothetical protein